WRAGCSVRGRRLRPDPRAAFPVPGSGPGLVQTRATSWGFNRTGTDGPQHSAVADGVCPRPRPAIRNGEAESYWGASVLAPSASFLRLSQLYLRWNFSTRPVVSTYFILPVKKGWQAEQISTVMFLRVLRVTNLLPQPQVTVVSSYLG